MVSLRFNGLARWASPRQFVKLFLRSHWQRRDVEFLRPGSPTAICPRDDSQPWPVKQDSTAFVTDPNHIGCRQLTVNQQISRHGTGKLVRWMPRCDLTPSPIDILSPVVYPPRIVRQAGQDDMLRSRYPSDPRRFLVLHVVIISFFQILVRGNDESFESRVCQSSS